MSFDAASNGAMLSMNRRKQTNPKQLHAVKQEMTVVDESNLGSYYQLTPRPSLEVPPPLLPTGKRSNSDNSTIPYKELLNHKRNSWPFLALFSVGSTPSVDAAGGPPPLAKVTPNNAAECSTSSTAIGDTPPSADQPINLCASESFNKRRSSAQINNPLSEVSSGDVLDLSSKPSSQARGSPSLSSNRSGSSVVPVAEVAPFVPPKAHSRQKFESSKWCRQCSREIEVTSLENVNGLCLTCQRGQLSPSPLHASAAPPTINPFPPPAVVNPLALSFSAVAPPPVLPLFDIAALAARLPGMFGQAALQFPVPAPPVHEDQLAAVRRDIEQRECDSTENAAASPAPSNNSNRDSPSTQFVCAKCNINFKSAKSLEAHIADYCQQTGAHHKPKGTKRRSVESNGTGQDLVCQLCGYHGHSERGIRVHFNAMHSIGSEIQLEQYLTTMIVRAESSPAGPAAINAVTTINPTTNESAAIDTAVAVEGSGEASTPSSKKRRLDDSVKTVVKAVGNVDNKAKKRVPRGYTSRSNGQSAAAPNTVLPGSNNNNGGTNGGSLRRQPPFECRLCAKTFPDTAKLRLHMRSHEKDESIMYSCKRCNNFTTPVKSDLVRHVKVEHEGVNMRLSTWTVSRQASNAGGRDGENGSASGKNNGELANGNSNGSDDGPTFCDICQISFRFKHSYEAHRQYYCMAKWTESTNACDKVDEEMDDDDDVDDEDQKLHIDVDDDNDEPEVKGAPLSSSSSPPPPSSSSSRASNSSADSQQHQPLPPSKEDDDSDENSSVDVTS